MRELVKIRLIRNIENYIPRQSDNIYFGIVYEEDDEQIKVKCFSLTSLHSIFFGTLKSFIKGDIEITKYNDDLYNFI